MLTALSVDDELRALCLRIVEEGLDEDQWALSESDDMFQSEHFAGGYEALERAFCFSYYDASATEYWFQIPLQDVQRIARGEDMEIPVRPAGA
jgi:hypothetical protein